MYDFVSRIFTVLVVGNLISLGVHLQVHFAEKKMRANQIAANEQAEEEILQRQKQTALNSVRATYAQAIEDKRQEVIITHTPGQVTITAATREEKAAYEQKAEEARKAEAGKKTPDKSKR